MIEYILNPQSVEALGWTLLHSVWQGAVFAILLVLILIAFRSYTAQSRYVVSVGVLCAFFLTVSATFWQHWQEADSQIVLMEQLINMDPSERTLMYNDRTRKIEQSNDGSQSSYLLDIDNYESHQDTFLMSFRNYYEGHLPLLVTIWFLGVLFLQLRFLGQLAYVQRLKHYGTQLFPITWKDKIEELEGKLRIQKKVSYLTSIRIESPMVIGWLKPVVLLPQQVFNSLTETEIYAVLAHELAHIRREDFIVNLMQTFLCNVFFFHPGVWWMSNRIDDEREHCCDDLAVAATGPAISYAKTLISVSELQLRMQGNTALAMALSGKNKKRKRGGFTGRIRRLFKVSNGAGTFREGFATACILITALFLGLVATGRTVQATDLPTPTEINKIESIADDKPPISIESKSGTETTTPLITRAEDKPISKISQVTDLNKLPVTAPEEPEEPEATKEPVEAIQPIETRIDALIMACREGDLDFVKTLVNSGIDVNAIGSKGFTPLMMATSKDEAEIVAYLLEKGANVNRSYNGWTALIEAADEGSLASMIHLLKAGAEVNYYWTENSPTAISMAASEGKLECLKLLLENGADINGIGKSLPPLHIAAAEDKKAIIDYLVLQKVDINRKDVTGSTALMYAATEGKQVSVNKLMKAGADVSIVDLKGYTARDYAEGEEEFYTRDILGIEQRPEIHQATMDGLIEKVERMVEQGTDVNTPDQYGQTPLHIASAQNHNIDMRVLLDLGADINAQDNQGRTPLMHAAADGKKDAVALLVSKVANVNIKDVDGMRAYEWARSGGNSELAKFLGLITENKTQAEKNKSRKTTSYDSDEKEQEKNLQKRIQNTVKKEVQKEVEKAIQKEIGKREILHVTDKSIHLRQNDLKEKTPALLEAVRNGSIEDCRKLLDKDGTVNTADDTGQTALMAAASSNRLDIAKMLIDQGADVNKSSASGLTALHYAALENHDQMARLLLRNNANIDATMRYSSTDGNFTKKPLVWEYIGATPLLIAVESQNIEVLTVLIDAGANIYHTLMRNEFTLNKDQVSYLSGSEVMGLDNEFRKNVDSIISDHSWTPYKQALLLNDPAILAFFPK